VPQFDGAEAARPYAEQMQAMLSSLRAGFSANDSAPILMRGTGGDKRHMLIVATSDRGLCGGFNGSILRAARAHARELRAAGKEVSFFCIGKKSYDNLSRDYKSAIVHYADGLIKGAPSYDSARSVAATLMNMLGEDKFDVCTLFYNHFVSVISQKVTRQQLIPLPETSDTGNTASYEFEPSEKTILEALLPRNLEVQIFSALLENAASEQGARMTAMDNATRNAGDMIGRLTLKYNRTRQAVITKELIEIISGAEAL
jgi:F-type H+-transporting ATPase subunit gamma